MHRQDKHAIFQECRIRRTPARLAVLNTLGDYPISAYQIATKLKKEGVVVDLASIYRTLNLFVEHKIAHAVSTGDNVQRFELVDDSYHHHHVICYLCGDIEDIQMNETVLLKEISSKTDCRIDHHHIEFFGTCANCQKRKKKI